MGMGWRSGWWGRKSSKVAIKEAEEETGIKNLIPLIDGIFGLNIITVFNHIKRGKQVNSHLHFDVEYIFEANEDDFIRIKEDENSGVDWIPIEKVISSSSEEHMKPIYQRLLDKMKTL
jgi:8-oxo-dGTP pyrophosphatase MutT (NUDIX family)